VSFISARFDYFVRLNCKQAAAWKPVVDLEVITFGQPRVGNPAWASYMDTVRNARSQKTKCPMANGYIESRFLEISLNSTE
jgi:hypothetical protein